MLMPRAYQYSAHEERRSRFSNPDTGRMSERPTSSANRAPRQHGQHQPEQNDKRRSTTDQPWRISGVAHSTPSPPVVISTRTTPHSNPLRDPSSGSLQRSGRQHHDPNAMSPSMAALLAVTSEPRSMARAIKGDHRRRLMDNAFRRSGASTSPRSWSILQSPPSPTDLGNEREKGSDIDFEIGSISSQTALSETLAMQRSFSSDSIPSLDIESEVFSSDSPPLPRTPSLRRARSPRRDKTKYLSTSEPLAAGELHPLSAQQSIEDSHLEDVSEEVATPSEVAAVELGTAGSSTSAVSRASHQFKSNLTASLQRLKSAARAINIPTPSVTSVLAINGKFIKDNRPPEASRPRSPLPLTNAAFSGKLLSPLDRKEILDESFAQRIFFSSTPGEEYRPIASSVQLQTYIRRLPDENPLQDRATAPPIFAMSSPPPPILLPGVDSPRPREPRENSDFLRVVVLEMNMRRAGKLGDVAGRARIWIGPRADTSQSAEDLALLQTGTEQAGQVTRAEKGMSEEVMTELAEAMGSVAATQNDRAGESSQGDADGEGDAKASGRKTTTPSRWVAWIPE